jgi:hypothetical protein
MMHYGVVRENKNVFLSQKYKKCGELSEHNRRALRISIIPARSYRLSPAESLMINEACKKVF